MTKAEEQIVENALSIDTEQNQNWLTSSPQNADKALDKINSITKVIDGAVRLALQRTKAQDWVLMGGNYYLEVTGVEKIRSVFGLYFKNLTITKELNDDGSYAYICFGEAGSNLLDSLYGPTTIWIEGSRSSSDPFFTKGNRTPDQTDIRKAAFANFHVRAAKALLGFGNYTKEDLVKMGVPVSGIASVEYGKGNEGGGHTECITEPQRKRLFAIASKNGIAEGAIKDWLKKRYGIDSTAKILKKDYEEICNAVESANMPMKTQEELPVIQIGK